MNEIWTGHGLERLEVCIERQGHSSGWIVNRMCYAGAHCACSVSRTPRLMTGGVW